MILRPFTPPWALTMAKYAFSPVMKGPNVVYPMMLVCDATTATLTDVGVTPGTVDDVEAPAPDCPATTPVLHAAKTTPAAITLAPDTNLRPPLVRMPPPSLVDSRPYQLALASNAMVITVA